MKNLFVSSYIENSIGRTIDPKDINYVEDLVTRGLELQEYLIGGDNSLKIGTHSEVTKWVLDKYKEFIEGNPKDIHEIWNNSEAVVIDIQNGIADIYTI